MTTVAAVFVAIAVILCIAAVLAMIGVGQLALSGADALERDGMARGKAAPRWSLPGLGDAMHQSPPAKPLQLIVFADHSLRSFPSVVDGLRALRDDRAQADPTNPAGLEILIMTRGPAEHSRAALDQLGLDGIPVVTGSPARYASYNVRVMPFAIFVDSNAKVRASSLVNHDWQLAKLWRVAAIPIEPAELAAV